MNPNPSLIPPVDLPAEARQMAELIKSTSENDVASDDELRIACTDIVILAWRLKKRLEQTSEESAESKILQRHVSGIISTLGSIGFVARDREGEKYDYGLPEKVVVAEKRPGISGEMVAETIRPSVFYKDRLIRAGEIVIAVPESVPENTSESVSDSAPESVSKCSE